MATARPDAELILAGRGSRRFLAAYRGPGTVHLDRVTATGFVADLGPLFRECRLFVAPLAEGGGIKIKILEAMARGIPVITTPVGAEGHHHRNGPHPHDHAVRREFRRGGPCRGQPIRMVPPPGPSVPAATSSITSAGMPSPTA